MFITMTRLISLVRSVAAASHAPSVRDDGRPIRRVDIVLSVVEVTLVVNEHRQPLTYAGIRKRLEKAREAAAVEFGKAGRVEEAAAKSVAALARRSRN